MARKNLIILLAAVMVLAGGCGKAPVPTLVAPTLLLQETETPTPMHTSTDTRAAVPSVTATQASTTTPLLTITPTPELFRSDYVSFPPGQYVVYNPGSIVMSYGIVSLDGKFQSPFIVGGETWSGAFTLNGERFAVFRGSYGEGAVEEDTELYVYDLSENTIERIPSGNGCYGADWSPDGTRLVANCYDNNFGIYIISLLDGTRSPLYIPTTDDVWVEGKPVWSPDGQWIAFILWSDSATSQTSQTGVFITDTACLPKPLTCQELTRGPYLFSTDLSWGNYIAWSPDSHALAVESGPEDSIYIVDIANETERTMIGPHTLGALFGLGWSYDGEWLAFSKAAGDQTGGWLDIYLLPTGGGEPVLLMQKGGEVEAWITIPRPFAPGEIYAITEVRSDLNLRDTPSLAGTILRQLQPDDTVTILSGPVEADGYTWWQMQTDDGTVGWAVNIPERYAPVGMTPTATP